MVRRPRTPESLPWAPWLSLAAVLLFTGCPKEGAVCTPGLSVCSDACVDLRADVEHCGACGTVCGANSVCQDGACACREGSLRCGETCVAVASDVANCGACGNACPSGQVCEAGRCGVGCSAGTSRCGDACVNLLADVANCGACGHACPDAQSCHAGVCAYDVVAACYNLGQVVGIQAGTDRLGPRRQLGGGVQSLAAYRNVLLAADATNSELLQAPAGELGQVSQRSSLGNVTTSPNDIFVAWPYVYVVDSINNTLQVLRGEGSGGGTSLGLRTVTQLSLGANTSPQGITRVGDTLFIPLFGTAGSGFKKGNAVARVEVLDPEHPRLLDSIPLTGLDLKSFDGGTSLPLPYSATTLNGAVYVALTNLNPANDYRPNGPGMLARIEPADGGVRAIDLGAEHCLNAGYVEPVGGQLVVSCLGEARYDTANGNRADDVRATGLALVKDDALVATYSLSAGCAPGTPECQVAVAGRFAVAKDAVYLADVNGGRVYVVEVKDGALVERRGFSTPGAVGPALDACPRDSRRPVSNVTDVVAIPGLAP
ncbi:hypothetical protein DRW03_13715 [Corallococcus sp. H22C18031201]|nr:hypothetical protein DRW03_13715 [Corallococcus sp. H22C18031201]